jgi:hypothetical protein
MEKANSSGRQKVFVLALMLWDVKRVSDRYHFISFVACGLNTLEFREMNQTCCPCV